MGTDFMAIISQLCLSRLFEAGCIFNGLLIRVSQPEPFGNQEIFAVCRGISKGTSEVESFNLRGKTLFVEMTHLILGPVSYR